MISSQHTLTTASKEIMSSSSRQGSEIINMFVTNTNASASKLVTIQQGTGSSKLTFVTFNIPPQVSIDIIDGSSHLHIPHKKSIFATASAGTDVILTINYKDV
tara:strand:- start:190 stop:498 length:309 start_codon:yes stop_codon:yes gene_type:complete